MIHLRPTSIYICKAAISFVLLLLAVPAWGQQRHKVHGLMEEPDTTKFFQGLAVSADLVGVVQMAVSDYGQFEAALRVNLKDRYFPVLELGYGKANHDEEATQMHYETQAPYGRIGVDMNLMKNKHDIYRVYGGVRYAFTSFKFDVSHPDLTDPIWGDTAPYGGTDVKSSYHWLELLMGVDAKIWGPIRLGWSLRYRRRLKDSIDEMGHCWYVPGYGIDGGSNLGGTFNVTFEI